MTPLVLVLCVHQQTARGGVRSWQPSFMHPQACHEREPGRARMWSRSAILALFNACVVACEQLVERVIGTVNPQVVMVELDAQRVGLLPKGEAHKVGVSWRLCFNIFFVFGAGFVRL